MWRLSAAEAVLHDLGGSRLEAISDTYGIRFEVLSQIATRLRNATRPVSGYWRGGVVRAKVLLKEFLTRRSEFLDLERRAESGDSEVTPALLEEAGLRSLEARALYYRALDGVRSRL